MPKQIGSIDLKKSGYVLESKTQYAISNTGSAPVPSSVAWTDVMPTVAELSVDSTNKLYARQCNLINGTLVPGPPYDARILDGLALFTNTVANKDANNNYTSINGSTITTGKIQDTSHKNFIQVAADSTYPAGHMEFKDTTDWTDAHQGLQWDSARGELNIKGNISANSLTIINGNDSYDGTAAINISGYDIEIVKDSVDVQEDVSVYLYPVLYHNGEKVADYIQSTDTSVDSSKTYYTRSGSAGSYVYTEVTNPSGDPSQIPYYEKQIDYSHFLWFQDDSEIGTAGDANNKGRYLATYGYVYRVTYDFDDGAVGGGTEVQTRYVDPQKYITKVNDYDITVHPESYQNVSSYIQLNQNGLNVFNSNGNSIAQYGSTARVGLNNSSRFLMNAASLEAYDNLNHKYFEVNSNGLSWGTKTAATTDQISTLQSDIAGKADTADVTQAVSDLEDAIDLKADASDVPTSVTDLSDGANYSTTTQMNAAIDNAKQIKTNSASGSVVTITDASAYPALDLITNVGPTQDLHGYDAPWVGGAGKNKLPYPYYSNSRTVNGITFTVNGDTSVTVQGTASGNANFNFSNNLITDLGLSEGDSLIVTDGTTYDSSSCYSRILYVDDSSGLTRIQNSYTLTITSSMVSRGLNFQIWVPSGTNVSTARTFYPMIRKSTEADATWQPYENICPISGHDEVVVYNDPIYGGLIEWNQLVQNGDFSDGTTGWSGTRGTLSANNGVLTCTRSEAGFVTIGRQFPGRYDVQNHICFIGFDVSVSNTGLGIRGSISNSSINTNTFENGTTLPTANEFYRKEYVYKPTSSGAYFLRIGSDMSSINGSMSLRNVMIIDLTLCFGAGNEPTTVDEVKALFPKAYYDYEAGTQTCVSAVNGDPYETYTTTLPSTTYGGTLDLVSGVLTVDRALVDLGTLEYTYDSSIPRFYSFGVNALVKAPLNNAVVNAISSSYIATSFNELYQTDKRNGTFSVGSTGTLSIINTSYTNATTFKTAMSGVQLVYELATPQIYSVSPQQVELLQGTNNLWTNSGDVDVTYAIISADAVEALNNPIDNASKVATSYITKIDNGGIKVHDAGDTSNYSKIDSTGLEVFNDIDGISKSVAKFGATSRIGESTSTTPHIDLTNKFMQISNNEKSYFGAGFVNQSASLIRIPYEAKYCEGTTVLTLTTACTIASINEIRGYTYAAKLIPLVPNLNYTFTPGSNTITLLNLDDLYIESTYEFYIDYNTAQFASLQGNYAPVLDEYNSFFGSTYIPEHKIAGVISVRVDGDQITSSNYTINQDGSITFTGTGTNDSHFVYISYITNDSLFAVTGEDQQGVIGVNSVSFGKDNQVSGGYSGAIGKGLTTVSSNQVAIGKYNRCEQDSLFMIGNGDAPYGVKLCLKLTNANNHPVLTIDLSQVSETLFGGSFFFTTPDQYKWFNTIPWYDPDDPIIDVTDAMRVDNQDITFDTHAAVDNIEVIAIMLRQRMDEGEQNIYLDEDENIIPATNTLTTVYATLAPLERNIFEIKTDSSIFIDEEPLADYIIEQGTEGNWIYRIWKKGMAECFYRGNYGTVTLGIQLSTDMVSSAMRLTFPTAVSFVEIPYCVIGFEGSTSGYANVQYPGGASTSTTQSQQFRLQRIGTSSVSLANCIFTAHVIGRWNYEG